VNSSANQPHRRTPATAYSRASRWVFTAASVLALTLAACSGGSPAASSGGPASVAPAAPSATAVASAPVSSATDASPAASSSANAGSGGDSLQISAQGIQYSTKTLQAPASKAFSITFANNDSGIPHNVEILDANNASVFKGAVFPGVATQTYQVPALKAGTYSFKCDVHPTIMTGTLTVG